MKLSFLELPPDERRLYIEQAAARRDVSAVMLEKDFWVCWLLGILFGSARLRCGIMRYVPITARNSSGSTLSRGCHRPLYFPRGGITGSRSE